MHLPGRMGDEIKLLDRNIMPEKLNLNKPQLESRIDTIDEQILNMIKIISHDLRGFLLSILANLKLLNRGYYGKMDENVKIKLEELFEKVKGLIGMTEDYIGRAFSINGDLGIEREVLDLKEDIINPVLKEFSHEIRERDLQIDNRLDVISKPPIFMKGSKLWLRAVFRNLLKNAINYGDVGGTIALGFEKQDLMYRVSIYNSGKPIPEDRRNKLFSIFNHNGRSNGMGMGLYFAKMVVQKHGGDIWYEAKEYGSNFILLFPIESGDSDYKV